MSYQILVNGSPFWDGTIMGAILSLIIFVAIIAGIVIFIMRKLRENNVLKYEFITIIAHKFRTPLTSVKWLIEGLIADETDARKKEGYVDIRQSTEKLISMTGTLIELTNTDNESRSSYTLEKISLCELAQDVAATLRVQFQEKNLTLSVHCPSEPVLANVDRVRMEFVIQTILENAKIYTPTGRKVDVYVSAEGRKASVAVVDNGIGIDRGDLGRIFGKFYRTANAKNIDTEGFGVGLYLAQAIVRYHKGKIQVHSDGLDKGSTFTITLPRAYP